MAGIKANATSATMGDGDTAVDKSVSGYITGETITLSTSPAGSSHSWGLAKPGGSSARADLSASTGTSVTFTPDVAGYYVVTDTVDSTTSYVLRINVTQTATADTAEALRFSPKADASVPTPPTGVAMYYSSTQGALAIKDSAGAVFTVDLTSV